MEGEKALPSNSKDIPLTETTHTDIIASCLIPRRFVGRKETAANAALKNKSCKADNGSFTEYLTEVVLKRI